MPNIFSACMHIEFDPSDGKDKILGASTIARFDRIKKLTVPVPLPLKVKFPGGTNREEYWISKKNDGEKVKETIYLNLTPYQVLKKETKEEILCEPLGYVNLIHEYSLNPKSISETTHTKYFFEVLKLSKSLPFNYKREFQDDDDTVLIQWWSVYGFFKSVIHTHNTACIKFFSKLFKDKSFRERNDDLFNDSSFAKGFIDLAKEDEQFRNDNLELVKKYEAIKF